MTKLCTLAVSAALATLPTIAAAETPASHRFTQDGQTYVYTTSTRHARQVIDGYNVATRGRFHLVVRDDMVSGEADGRPVAFRVASSRGAVIETAQR